MLKAENITLGYGHGRHGNTVVSRLSFSVPSGSILAITGPSGCGKTTLLNALAGITRPLEGRILFKDRELSPKTCSIGLIPQNYGLLPWKTVRENCLFCSGIKESFQNKPALSPSQTTDRLLSLCGKLNILSVLDRYPAALSGGQAQRAALARAFLMNPDLLLMDEPFAALDISAAENARRICYKLCREYASTMILITHRTEDAMYLADRIAVMENGGAFRYICDNPWKGMDTSDSADYDTFQKHLQHELMQAAEVQT